MKSITSHRVNGLNESIQIDVLDQPGQGGACHEYLVQPMAQDHPQGAINPFTVKFQNGPIKEVGVNGASGEALLAIVEDRLKDFQSGPFACRENAVALTKIQEAMMWLHRRTNERMQRGVEGTNVK